MIYILVGLGAIMLGASPPIVIIVATTCWFAFGERKAV